MQNFGRLYFTPVIYVISGIAVLITLVLMINTYVLHLKVETAVVSVPLEAMVSPVAGSIAEIYVVPGATVKKGAKLFKIENFDLMRELELARIQVEDAKLNVAYAQALLVNETKRLQLYAKIGSHRVISTQSQENISQQALINAQHNLERFRVLHKKHYMSDVDWEAEQAKFVSAEESLKDARAQKNIENSSLHAISNGMYFTGNKLEGNQSELQAQFSAAEKRLQLSQEKFALYQTLNNKLTMLAPFDGKVAEILKSPGNTSDTVKPILLLENTQIGKNIIAYLTQDEITHVALSGTVKFYTPSTGTVYHGKIKLINRTEGFVDGIKAQYTWRDFQLDRSAMVAIDIDQAEQKKFNQDASAGLPAIVYFSRRFV